MNAKNRAGGTARAVRPAFATLLALLGTLLVLHAAGLALFTSGFLLQRVELAPRAACAPDAPADVPAAPAGAAAGDAAALREWDTRLEQGACTFPPRFRKAVVWIIDALRYDFLVPPTNASLADPYIHGHLRALLEAATNAPSNAFLAHFPADAPTTTLQRLKGLTTGSLPTFIEAGANFGGAGRVAEDNWIAQFRTRVLRERGLDANASTGAGMAFVGDDTWDMVFSALFDDGRSWPYSSFNVEDLDTVDAGVEEHMLREMQRPDTSLVIAHSLGVDHVGHRFGPAHPRMVPKLAQMDALVRRVMDQLDDDTLFVLLGDHGMDATGDHGGDSELEVGAGLFMYAKRGLLRGASAAPLDVEAVRGADAFAPFAPLDGTHRSVPQIDLVPTLALLLGVPIPFNNLGTVIPELFGAHGDELLRALRMNARQVHTYLAKYAEHATDLAAFRTELDALWHDALRLDAAYADLAHGAAARLAAPRRAEAARYAAQAYAAYTRRAVHHARSVWAQFADAKIAAGLVVLGGAVLVTYLLWRAAAYGVDELSVVELGAALRPYAGVGAGVGAAVATVCAAAPRFGPLSAWDATLFFPALGAELGVVVGAVARRAPRRASTAPIATAAAVVLLGVHAATFASNSFTMWEDRITLALLGAVLLARAISGYSAPTTRLQQQMPLLALGALVLVRIAATSRVCREEQAPYCVPSFYARTARADGRFAENPAYAYAGPATNSPWMSGVAYVVALVVPNLLYRMLSTSQSQHGTATTFLTWVLRPSMMLGAAYWLADWAHGLDTIDESARAWLLALKQCAGLTDLVLVGVLGTAFWLWAPLPISARHQLERVSILGFGNSFGSAMVLLVALVFALLFLLAQPTGQVALALCFLAIVVLAELGDNERDTQLIRAALVREAAGGSVAPRPVLPTLLESVTLALLGWVAFFATGHQATFAAIQWRVAFVGFTTVTYPWSPLWVVLNAFGPLVVLPAFGVVLLALWNVAPHRDRSEEAPAPPMTLASSLLRATTGFLLAHAVLALSAAAFACFFRRHLMLFKIWVPRFMTGALALLLADVAVLLAVGAAWRISGKVHRIFASRFT